MDGFCKQGNEIVRLSIYLFTQCEQMHGRHVCHHWLLAAAEFASTGSTSVNDVSTVIRTVDDPLVQNFHFFFKQIGFLLVPKNLNHLATQSRFPL
jgi:hypothetical protein